MTDSIVTDPVDIDSGMYNKCLTLYLVIDQKLQMVSEKIDWKYCVQDGAYKGKSYS